ncbi:MAG: copper resistance protein CopC [Kineosporiaceae bacterium]
MPSTVSLARPAARPAARVIVAVVLAVLAVGVLATPGAAHARLTGTSPADGATLEALPLTVRLTFSDPLDPQFVRVRVTGPQAAEPVTAETTIAEPVVEGPTVTVPIPLGGRAGSWTVDYRVVSRDGHPVSGGLTFSVTGSATPIPATPIPATPVPATPVEPASAAGTPGPAWAAVGGLAVLAAFGAVYAAAGRRSR